MKFYIISLGNYGDYLNPYCGIYATENQANRRLKFLKSTDKNYANYYKVEIINVHSKGVKKN